MTEGQLDDRSLGELVASATGSVSRLVKSEIELAKMELKGDAKKAAYGAVLFAIAGLAGGMVVILLSIAAAYGLVAAGIWTWVAFLIVAGAYVLLAAALIGIGLLRMRRMSALKRTRQTVTDDIAMLRRSGDDDEQPALTE